MRFLSRKDRKVDYDSLETDKRIIEAAKVVFIRKGYDETKMIDIAKEAGISRTTLNYYYHNKEQLFKPILEHFFLAFFPGAKSAFYDEKRTVIEKIDFLIDWYFIRLIENESLAPFVVIAIQRMPKMIATIAQENILRFSQAILFIRQVEKEMEEGRLKKMDYNTVLITFYSQIVFPFLIRPLMNEVNDQADDLYVDYIETYKAQVKETMHRILIP